MKRLVALMTLSTVLVFLAGKAASAPLTATTKFDLEGTMSQGYRHAVEAQSTGAFHRAWGTGAVIFGSGGIPVIYLPAALVQIDCFGANAIGCHSNNGAQRYILITAGMPAWETAYVVDHEILETMVDPYPLTDPTEINGHIVEVCDPDERTVGRWSLASWVGPNYFENGGIV